MYNYNIHQKLTYVLDINPLSLSIYYYYYCYYLFKICYNQRLVVLNIKLL